VKLSNARIHQRAKVEILKIFWDPVKNNTLDINVEIAIITITNQRGKSAKNVQAIHGSQPKLF